MFFTLWFGSPLGSVRIYKEKILYRRLSKQAINVSRKEINFSFVFASDPGMRDSPMLVGTVRSSRGDLRYLVSGLPSSRR
jgi:hypothetical protein